MDAVIWVAVAVAGTERPPPLARLPGCELWSGTSDGNDPTQLIEFRLCGAGGSMQSSSLNSGYSVRAIDGRWDGDTLVLRDTGFEVNKPGDGWRFCLVDEYRLTRVGDRLEGTYDSAACDDHARIWLIRQADVPAAVVARPPPPVTPPFEPPRTCGCASTRGSASILALLAVSARRRAGSRPRAAG